MDSNTECGICYDEYTDPYETPCKHVFCQECLTFWFNGGAKNTCPFCRRNEITMASCKKGENIMNQINNAPTDCPNRKNGCSVRPLKRDIGIHQVECQYTPQKLEERKRRIIQQLEVDRAVLNDKLKNIGNMSNDDIQVFITDSLKIAKNLFELAEYVSVKEILDRIIALSPTNLEPYLMLIDFYQIKGDIANVSACFNQIRGFAEEATGRLGGIYQHKLGEFYLNTGRAKDAEVAFNKSIQMLNGYNREQGSVLMAKALLFKKESKYNESFDIYNSAMERMEESDPLYIVALTHKADVLRKIAKYQDSYKMYEMALIKSEILYGQNHPIIAEIVNSMGLLLKKEGKYKDALKLYSKACRIYKLVFGNEHCEIGAIEMNIGDIHRKESDYDLADLAYNRAEIVIRKTKGESSIAFAELCNCRALILKKRGKYDDAEILYQKALSIIIEKYGQEHYKYGIVINNLADIYRKKRDFTLAFSTYEIAYNILVKVYGPNHSEVAEILYNKGLTTHQMGDYKKAIGLYEDALTILNKEFQSRHYKQGLCLNARGLVNAMLKEYGKAYQDLREAQQILSTTLGPEHLEVADTFHALGDICMKLVEESQNMERLKEAEGYYMKEAVIVEKKLGCMRLISFSIFLDII